MSWNRKQCLSFVNSVFHTEQGCVCQYFLLTSDWITSTDYVPYVTHPLILLLSYRLYLHCNTASQSGLHSLSACIHYSPSAPWTCTLLVLVSQVGAARGLCHQADISFSNGVSSVALQEFFICSGYQSHTTRFANIFSHSLDYLLTLLKYPFRLNIFNFHYIYLTNPFTCLSSKNTEKNHC